MQKPREEFKKESRYRTNLLFDEQASVMVEDSTFEELKAVIKKAKKNKTPGLDGISMDRFKCMEKDTLHEILNIINRWRLEDRLPKTLTEADVVTTFRKGNVGDPSNYRPIALLQSLYKIHAALLRNRLIKGLDDRIYRSQHGFRSKRSTAQPLFIARRLIDIAEAAGEDLFLVFLDWEKAFDTIDQEELINAVWRMNVPDETIKELSAMYTSIKFRIKDGEGFSSEREQRTGIRQGCPLSPYLFIILMTAMFADVHAEAGKQVWTTAAKDVGSTDLLYADDTLLTSSTAKAANQLLETIIKHSKRFGMRLNEGKCEYFAISTEKTKDVVAFPNGKPFKSVQQATYLRGHLQANGSAKSEIEYRISKAATIFRKLRPVWSDSGCALTWKLRVFDAIVLPVLFYGLEGVVFTKALEARVDYFQSKCLRNILKVGAAYYSRVSSKDILNQASQALHGVDNKLRPVSKVISDRAITLLGHLIRADNNDQMRKVAIDAEFIRVERYKRRVGRPRFYWLQNTMARAHKLWRKSVSLPKVRFNINNATLRREIAEATNNRAHPFDKKCKAKRKKVKNDEIAEKRFK